MSGTDEFKVVLIGKTAIHVVTKKLNPLEWITIVIESIDGYKKF